MSKRIKMKWQKCQTAKQSVFLRIQVRASSQTKGLDDFFTDFEKKTDCFAVYRNASQIL